MRVQLNKGRARVETVLVSWSGGKDSAMALYEIQRAEQARVIALLTTFTRDADDGGRVGIHNVRRELIEAQAASINLPLRKVFIAPKATNAEYESTMIKALAPFRDEEGIEQIVYGDLFLEDIRAYREQFLARHRMRGIYPVWGRDTLKFAADFIKLGFKAVVVSVNAKMLDESFAGKMFDADFLERLPPNIDPCGERGEFHTFVYDGIIFEHELKFRRGKVAFRDDHYCCELLPD
ncbi:MAG: diphthine--ammonia ligase [Pyrinomonadaceae bacterium]